MKLVINSDRVIAALIRDSKCREIILSGEFEFLSMDFARLEIEEHEDEILQKAGLSKAQFNTILTILFAKIVVVSEMVISNKMKQARKIMDRIDPNDTPITASFAVEVAAQVR